MGLSDNRIYKMLDDNPELSRYKKNINDDNTIFIIEPNDGKYRDIMEFQLSSHLTMSTSMNLIVDLLSHDDSYNLLLKLFSDELKEIKVLILDSKGKKKVNYVFDKKSFYDVMLGINNYSPDVQKRCDELIYYCSFEKYIDDNKDVLFHIGIDQVGYDIKIGDIIKFLLLSNDEVDNILKSDPKEIYGYPAKEFLFAVRRFYFDEKLAYKYTLDSYVKDNIRKIESSDDVDIQALNDYLFTDDIFVSRIKLNKELEDEILRDIKEDYNPLEKALYIYMKMCKVFTYDEEFYAVLQTGPLAMMHKNLEYINKISLENNKVVCFEFNVIFAYFLRRLGINYKYFVATVNDNEREFNLYYDSYGHGHTLLKFRFGKFIVRADSVTRILNGDMFQAKLNQPLEGLTCDNRNQKTKEEFSNIYAKVYNYISEKEKKVTNNEVDEYETFDEVLSSFHDVSDKIRPVNINDKIDLLLRKVNASTLTGIDAYSYLLQLRKVIFNHKEQEENIQITVIRSYDSKERNSASTIAIISLTLSDENDNSVTNRYLYTPGSKLDYISLEDLNTRFSQGLFGYIGMDGPDIPGIKR